MGTTTKTGKANVADVEKYEKIKSKNTKR